MIDWDEVERRVSAIIGVGHDEDQYFSLLYEKSNKDPSSWVATYEYFFEDYEKPSQDRFFDKTIIDFFYHFDTGGLLGLFARVMLRDGLTPRDLPELCAAVGRAFERFHQKFFVEADAVQSGASSVVLDPDLYPGWEYKDFEEPLEFQVRMVFLLQLWQYLPQVILWRKRFGKLYYWVMDDLKRHCADFAILEPWGYHYYQDDYDERFDDRYELVNRIRLDANLRITKLHMQNYPVMNLSPLSSLTELQYIFLASENAVADLSPLESLSKLETFVLVNDLLTDEDYFRRSSALESSY